MSDEIIFKGIDRNEVLHFIASVRKKAFACGKQRDYDWMADFAATCLEDEALEWFEDLKVEDQQDWMRLRQELLNHWPKEPPGGWAPAPPAAAPPPVSFGTPSTQASGVVQVMTDNGFSYLSDTLSKDGQMRITDQVKCAVRVSFQWSDTAHEIRFENDFAEHPLLGFYFNQTSIDVYGESALWAYLSPYQLDLASSDISPKKTVSGRRLAPSKWRVDRDSKMRPYVTDDDTGKSRELDILLNMETKVLIITHDPLALLKDYKALTTVKLIFDPR